MRNFFFLLFLTQSCWFQIILHENKNTQIFRFESYFIILSVSFMYETAPIPTNKIKIMIVRNKNEFHLVYATTKTHTYASICLFGFVLNRIKLWQNRVCNHNSVCLLYFYFFCTNFKFSKNKHFYYQSNPVSATTHFIVSVYISSIRVTILVTSITRGYTKMIQIMWLVNDVYNAKTSSMLLNN